MPSSCSRGLVGVGGQFCSRKEKQISGMRGLVLLRPPQGRTGPSVGEEDLEVSFAVAGLLSSALSSGYGGEKRMGDFHACLKNFLLLHREVGNKTCSSGQQLA